MEGRVSEFIQKEDNENRLHIYKTDGKKINKEDLH
jgi:hypothetical protein